MADEQEDIEKGIAGDLEKALDGIFAVAQAACQDILALCPDLLVVLAHGGLAPLHALRLVWNRAQAAPLPLLLITNIGSEKIDIYERFRNALPSQISIPFVAALGPDEEVGRFLAWVPQQAGWLAQLRGQVESVLGPGSMPQRILILDDFFHEGGTALLALKLFETLYPRAGIKFLAGRVEWKCELGMACLLEHGFTPANKETRAEICKLIFSLATGTEDVAEDSFFYRDMKADNPQVVKLSGYISLDTCLKLPGWIFGKLDAGIRQRIETHSGTTAGTDSGGVDWRALHAEITPAHRMYEYICLHGSITRAQLVEAAGISPRQAARTIERALASSELLPLEGSRPRRYGLSPWLTIPYEERPAGPRLGAYWVIPQRWMVGRAPDSFEEDLEKTIPYLLECGVTHLGWLFKGRMALWDEQFDRVCAEAGRKIEQILLPVGNWKGTLRRNDLRRSLDLLEQALQSGAVIYLAEDGTPELVGLVIGCYLVEHGQAGVEALRSIQALRAGTADAWRRVPASEKFRRMVRRWKA